MGNVFSSKTTDFHRTAGLFELNFLMRKTFRSMVKPGEQNRPHSWSPFITEFFFFSTGLRWFPGSA